MNKLYDIDKDIENLNETDLVHLLLYGNTEKYNVNTNTNILNSSISYIHMSTRFEGPLL